MARAVYDALAALGGRLAGTLSLLKASIARLASATDATGPTTLIPQDIPHQHLDELLHLMHERKLI